jgi:hypothetical protein
VVTRTPIVGQAEILRPGEVPRPLTEPELYRINCLFGMGDGEPSCPVARIKLHIRKESVQDFVSPETASALGDRHHRVS